MATATETRSCLGCGKAVNGKAAGWSSVALCVDREPRIRWAIGPTYVCGAHHLSVNPEARGLAAGQYPEECCVACGEPLGTRAGVEVVGFVVRCNGASETYDMQDRIVLCPHCVGHISMRGEV